MTFVNPVRLKVLILLVLAASSLVSAARGFPVKMVEEVSAADVCASKPKGANVVLGSYLLCVPESSIVDYSLPWYLRGIEYKLPQSEGIGLAIDAEEAAGQIDGFQAYDGSLPDDLNFIVELLDQTELAAYLDAEMHVYSDSWYGRGLMENRIVESHESGFFKVQVEGRNVFWKVLKITPDASKPPPKDPSSWFLASCRETSSPLSATGLLSSCHSFFVYDNLRFSVYFNGNNLAFVEEIRTLLVNRFLSYVVEQ